MKIPNFKTYMCVCFFDIYTYAPGSEFSNKMVVRRRLVELMACPQLGKL